MDRFTNGENTKQQVEGIYFDIVKSFSGVQSDVESESLTELPKGYDIKDLILDINSLLKEYSKRSEDFKDFSFAPQMTYNILGEDEQSAVRFKLHRRQYGTVQQQPIPGGGTRSEKWMLLGVLDDIENPGYKVHVFQKSFDNILDIISWSKNYRDADNAAYIIEDLLDTYKYIFKRKGVERLSFQERMEPLFRDTGGTGIHGVPLRYYARTTKIKVVYQKTLESIAAELLVI